MSLHEAVSPLVMTLNPEWGLIVKLKGKDISGLLTTMKNAWAKFNPDEPFDYAFMDELYNKTYIDEQKTGRIMSIITVLTIAVACLGLFGLVTFTAEQRKKEIGIRKVLGASVTGIVQLLSKDFLRLVLLAIVIATPVAWWAMNKWLQDFAYHIDISWWVFAIAGCIVSLIALITLSFQAIKAAITNPVKSLRTE